MAIKLSKRGCEEATYPEGIGTKMAVLWDTATPGFGLRVYPSNRKSWVIQFRSAGRQRFVTLGKYEHFTLEKARDEAKKALGLISSGEEPTQALRKAHSITFEELGKMYMEEWSKKKKRSWREDERILNSNLYPKLGTLPVASITRVDIRALLDALAKRAPISANRTLAVIRKMFNWALEQELVETTPVVGIKAPTVERRKERVLTEAEIKLVWGNLPKTHAGQALRFVLATAQRPGEVLALNWREVSNNWWTIPGNKAKNGKSHRVFLSPLALSLMGKRGTGSVFGLNGKPQATALIQAAARFCEASKMAKWTPHDLRRTAASNLASGGVSRVVLAAILNHTDRSVTAIYDRHSYDREKQEALEVWGERLSRIVTCEENLPNALH